MALLPAKCTECGGFVEVDNEKRLGVCQHCGNPFVVEEAIQTFNSYYNITNNYNTNNNFGEGAVVNIYENKEKDFVIKGGILDKYQGESVDVIIPDGVLGIASNCFRGLGIKSVTIPDSVTRIGYSAFAYCQNLESVIIPHGVTRIDDWAFASCTSLKAINIPNSVTMIGDSAFFLCTSLTSVTMPRSIYYMGRSVFGETPYGKR